MYAFCIDQTARQHWSGSLGGGDKALTAASSLLPASSVRAEASKAVPAQGQEGGPTPLLLNNTPFLQRHRSNLLGFCWVSRSSSNNNNQ